jgi:hypothetical protein
MAEEESIHTTAAGQPDPANARWSITVGEQLVDVRPSRSRHDLVERRARRGASEAGRQQRGAERSVM